VDNEGEDATDEAADAGAAMLIGIEGDITDGERRSNRSGAQGGWFAERLREMAFCIVGRSVFIQLLRAL